MKYLIFGTLAFLLFLSQTTFAQQWKELSSTEVVDGADSGRINNLYAIAEGYILQKGLFESTKAPLPGNSYILDFYSRTIERRNTSTLIYYRFNFTLNEQNGPSAVYATVTTSYNPSNSNFKVTNYNYKFDSDGNESYNGEETGEQSHISVDTRTATGDGDFAAVVSDLFDAIVAENVESESIPDAEYEIQFVYAAYMQEDDGFDPENANEEGEVNNVEIVNEEDVVNFNEQGEGQDSEFGGDGGSILIEESAARPAERIYDLWLKAKSSEGKYYYVTLKIDYIKENGEFYLVKSGSWGDIHLLS